MDFNGSRVFFHYRLQVVITFPKPKKISINFDFFYDTHKYSVKLKLEYQSILNFEPFEFCTVILWVFIMPKYMCFSSFISHFFQETYKKYQQSNLKQVYKFDQPILISVQQIDSVFSKNLISISVAEYLKEKLLAKVLIDL